ncbi:MAG: hypothetical protein GXO79_05715 [Chlorobi bacterium]|nr:hypothetical protein [Chlorobiota bacterium]
MKKFEKLINEKNKSIFFNHQKKDINALKNSLDQLKSEHDNVKEDLNTISYMLSLIDKHSFGNDIKTTNDIIEHNHISKWIKETKAAFEKLYLMNSEELKQSDKEFISAEKVKLTSEFNRLEKQLNYLDAIIAKTVILLQDLQENLCKSITKGYDLAAIGEKLLEKFGKKTDLTLYSVGRKNFIKFIEDTFLINKIKSKEILDLLIERKVLDYVIDLSNIDVTYYNNNSESNNFIPVEGNWIINS